MIYLWAQIFFLPTAGDTSASIEKDVIDREKESHLPREKEYWVRAACSFTFPYPR